MNAATGSIRGLALAVALASCAGCARPAPPAERDIVGTWEARLPAASTPGRHIALILSSGNSAELRTDYLNGQPPIVELGTWAIREDGTVNVVLARNAVGPVTTEIGFTLVAAQLVSVRHDTLAWGSAGLTLQKRR